MNIALPAEIRDALQHGADLAISVSGGKDSDAMAVLLAALHRRHQWPGRITLIHADLGRAEWPQTLPHIRALAHQLELPLAVVLYCFLCSTVKSAADIVPRTSKYDRIILPRCLWTKLRHIPC